jgi:hypothetical protein
MITTNKYGHELVTIQLTLSKDDVAFLQEIVETGEDMGVGICQHIIDQYNAITFGKTLADMTLEEDKQFQARLNNIPHKE